jgi:hypothetical protein
MSRVGLGAGPRSLFLHGGIRRRAELERGTHEDCPLTNHGPCPHAPWAACRGLHSLVAAVLLSFIVGGVASVAVSLATTGHVSPTEGPFPGLGHLVAGSSGWFTGRAGVGSSRVGRYHGLEERHGRTCCHIRVAHRGGGQPRPAPEPGPRAATSAVRLLARRCHQHADPAVPAGQ